MSISSTHSCDLCRLPVAGKAFERVIVGQSRRFCCDGCLNVYTILSESGALEHPESSAAFRLGSDLGLVARPEGSAIRPPPPMEHRVEREVEIPIQGMWCASCAWLIERVLQRQEGVLSCEVQYVRDLARVRYTPERISRQQIQDRIRELGYDPVPPGNRSADRVQRDLLVRFAVACAPGMYMMMFNVVLYTGYFERLDPGIRSLMQQLLLVISLPIVTWCAWPIYVRAWAALRQGATSMETLITLGAGSAFLYSVYATVRHQQQVYFDTASMIITLVLLGKYLEAVARSRATSAAGSLQAMLPTKVRLRLRDGSEQTVSADRLQPGDWLIVVAGSTVPVDGIVVDGTAAIDESLLTGEAVPVRRGPGDRVVGASLCVEGGLVVEATQIGAETVISRMAKLVHEAMASRSGSERLADRVSRVFVPLIIASAAVVFAWNVGQGRHVDAALMKAVSMMVVACPCALGMATPLAIAAAMGSAASRGILIRNSRSLENARKIDTVVLDKTGTLTLGRLQVLEVVGGERIARHSTSHLSVWDAIASLEALSQHPAGRAIVGWIQARGGKIHADVELEILPGLGIRGRVGDLPIVVGAAEIVQDLPAEWQEPIHKAEAQGRTVVAAACAGDPICAFILGDAPRPGAAEAVAKLKATGIDVWLISGDSLVTSNAIAQRLGIDNVMARALPTDKIAKVRELRASGRRVAMVGDGINDGPALAEADVGIAMGQGTQVALEAADLALMHEDLRHLPYAFELSRRTLRIIRQNLFWALVYNVLSIPAAAGLYGERFTVGPLFAAAAMLTSSLSVVFNSLRLQDPEAITR